MQKFHATEVSDVTTNLRQHERRSVDWRAVCSADGSEKLPVIVQSASLGGFGLSCDLPFAIGTRIDIELEDIGLFPAEIVWKRDERCGVRLLDEEEALVNNDVEHLSDFLQSLSDDKPQS